MQTYCPGKRVTGNLCFASTHPHVLTARHRALGSLKGSATPPGLLPAGGQGCLWQAPPEASLLSLEMQCPWPIRSGGLCCVTTASCVFNTSGFLGTERSSRPGLSCQWSLDAKSQGSCFTKECRDFLPEDMLSEPIACVYPLGQGF